MKKSWLVVIVLFLTLQRLEAQSSYIFSGSSDKPVPLPETLNGNFFLSKSSYEGKALGQLMAAQHMQLHFKERSRRFNNFHQAAASGEMLLKTEKFDLTTASKMAKRTMASGFYFGASYYELIFVSIDVGWLSNHRFGVDLSYRISPITFEGDSHIYAAFIGLVYRLGNSRFAVKAGGEHFWSTSEEFHDDESWWLVFVGGKYWLPITGYLGMQVNAGSYLGRRAWGFPAAGIGLSFTFNPK